MEEVRLVDKLDDLIVRINRMEVVASVLGEKQRESMTLMSESLSQLKVVSHVIEAQVRANQLEIAKLTTQAKIAGGFVGIIAGGVSGLLSSLLRGG